MGCERVIEIDRDKCVCCEECWYECPVNVFWIHNCKIYINTDECICCEICMYMCPTDAIEVYNDC